MTNDRSTVASKATTDALELPSLLALCAEFGATDVGRGRVLALEPLLTRREVEHRQALVRDTWMVLKEGALIPSREEELIPLLAGLGDRQPSVAGLQLIQLGSVLQTTRQARARVEDSDTDISNLKALIEDLPDLEPLRRRISKSLDRRGRVKDDASPQLVRLRRQVHGIRDGLYKQLHHALAEDAEHFSSDTVSLKDGRLTLLLQSSARGRMKGLVHGRSGTGQSLYFEPLATVEGNNRLQESLEEEEAERQRIIAEIHTEAQQQLPEIETHFEILGELDMLQSICRFAERSEGLLPEIGDSGELKLSGARHPLLDPRLSDLRAAALGQAGHQKSTVPLDLELDDDRRMLVITGPNAGGKTVALKTVGLLALAAQCGLPIPTAPGTRLPIFRAVMAMVGDEQDLLNDRSTFSARLMRLKEAWEVAGEGSLVLLDEVGSGTDPEEGSALAVALLEGLLESGTLGVLTTHLTQLAAVALERSGASCAAMEFDPESGKPTYYLRPGAPGGSQALALAKRLGLPQEWLERADSLLGKEHRDLRELLAEVEEVRRSLAEAQVRLEAETSDVETHRRRLAEELQAAGEERRRMGPRMKAELETFRSEVMRNLRAEQERLRQEVAKGKKKGLVSAGVSRLFEDAPQIETGEETDESVELGGMVRHSSLGWTGRLDNLRGDTADVVVNGKRLRCALEDLVAVRDNGAEKSRRPPTVELSRGGSGEADLPGELKLIGSRVEPALDELDRYLDRALLSSRRHVRIVHGFGTGRLRQAIRELLGSHPAVAGYRAGDKSEGGDGATVVTLNKT